jgi:hypothetical protein
VGCVARFADGAREWGDMTSRHRSVLVLVILASTLAAAACSSTGSTGITTVESSTTTSTVLINSGCSKLAPRLLGVSANSTYQRDYPNGITACTNAEGTVTVLTNHTNAVWALGTHGPSVGTTAIQPSAEVKSYLAIVRTVDDSAVLPPTATIEVFAGPTDVYWTLESNLSATWVAHDELYTKLLDVSENALIEALTPGSSRARAMATCALATYQVANAVGGGSAQSLIGGLGVAANTEGCTNAWQAADDADLRVDIPVPKWQGNLEPFGPDANDFFAEAHDSLDVLDHAGDIAAFLLH